ncbi:gonadotropin subunit beta-1-like isoform X1 [Phyllopteryx taeniolatus]|uniref:gonadotropin subunit beta-1-like isoform X1 n=1 Tax=Phyllopteryx taeniolatus TaxID=161469 RepID=UPI002AD3F67D|nr:gonadotropin subunit beta-1-like isoform X1 [Phyllopteryx taeniolatus]
MCSALQAATITSTRSVRALTHTEKGTFWLRVDVSIQQDLLRLQPTVSAPSPQPLLNAGDGKGLRRYDTDDSPARLRRMHAKDPVYLSATAVTEHYICNGVWIYEDKRIEGCSVGVTYPVAESCMCTSCNEDNTYCGRLPGSC